MSIYEKEVEQSRTCAEKHYTIAEGHVRKSPGIDPW